MTQVELETRDDPDGRVLTMVHATAWDAIAAAFRGLFHRKSRVPKRAPGDFQVKPFRRAP